MNWYLSPSVKQKTYNSNHHQYHKKYLPSFSQCNNVRTTVEYWILCKVGSNSPKCNNFRILQDYNESLHVINRYDLGVFKHTHTHARTHTHKTMDAWTNLINKNEFHTHKGWVVWKIGTLMNELLHCTIWIVISNIFWPICSESRQS